MHGAKYTYLAYIPSKLIFQCKKGKNKLKSNKNYYHYYCNTL